jgi:hypothetical protein
MTDDRAPHQCPSPSEFLGALDVEAGWPPRLKTIRPDYAAKDASRHLRHAPIGGAFDAATRRARVQTALRSPDVAPLLQGRWSVLGVHRLSVPRAREDERVRVCIFDYTSNRLADVYLRNGTIERVAIGGAHQHPESAMEVRQAIAVARSHPELRARVTELEAHGILRVPTAPASAACGHRCIEVFFVPPNDVHMERSVSFSALVDMTLQQVVGAGSCRCTDDSTAGTPTHQMPTPHSHRPGASHE